jgi:hypothetical protein
VSAATGGKSRSDRVLFGFLKGLAWVVLVLVALDINVRRANALDGGDEQFKHGYATGGFLLALALAFALWFVVQHAIRKRRGYPPWIAVIAIGFSLLFALTDVFGKQGRADAYAPAPAASPCPADADPFGAAPAGWSFDDTTLEKREGVLGDMGMRSYARTANVVAASRAGQIYVFLIAISDIDAEGWRRGAENDGLRGGARVTHPSIGGEQLRDIDFSGDGGHAVLGGTACTLIMATGYDDRAVETVARAVFTG